MKIRFEIELPEITTEENPTENYWKGWEDWAIEEALSEYAIEVLTEQVRIKINQDDLKEFIKQVREHGQST